MAFATILGTLFLGDPIGDPVGDVPLELVPVGDDAPDSESVGSRRVEFFKEAEMRERLSEDLVGALVMGAPDIEGAVIRPEAESRSRDIESERT
jgi:hypothetical protein